MDVIAAYLPQDRRQALARGVGLPDRAPGAALFADISGFTSLTEALAEQLGPRRGAEALTRQLDAVYDALIAKVEFYGGSVLGFAGDAITCWFEDQGMGVGEWRMGNAAATSIPQPLTLAALRATACALALQTAMAHFAMITLPNGTLTALALKVAVASGTARRLVVGDPDIQLIDTLAGATVARTARAEHLAQSGEILIDAATATTLGAALDIAEWREDQATGERFAVLAGLQIADCRLQIDPVDNQSTIYNLQSEMVRPWLLPAVYEREQAGHGTFLTEFRYLRDRGLDPRDAMALDQIALPNSLHSLILSRIDQLTNQQQLTLKVASVIGRRFGFDDLRGYYPALGAPEPIKADLDVLAALDLTPLNTIEPELAYLFKHIVTHEVAYESLTYATRATLHEEYARFIEARAGDATQPYLDLLAYHYDHTENLPKRREYLRRAGEAAQAAYANAAALDYYERLVPLIADMHDQIDIHMKLGAVLELTGRWIEAEAHYQEALVWADRVNDVAAQARTQHALGKLFRLRGAYDAALAWLEQERATWAALNDRAGLSQVLAEIGLVLWYTGAYADAQHQLEAGLALAREHGDPVGIAAALNHLGLVVRDQGDYAAAHALYNESLALRQALGDKRGIAWALNNLGGMAFAQGDYTVAQAHFEASLALRRDIGDKHGTAISLGNLGIVADEQGDFAAARALHNQSLVLQQAIGDKWGVANTLGNLGLVAAAQGDYAAAQVNYSASQALQRALGNKSGLAASSMYLGLLALAQKQPDQAQVLFGESLAQFYAIGDKRFVAHCLASLAVLMTDESVGPLTVTRASQAARLSGATTSIMESLTIQLDREVRKPYQRAIGITQARLGDQAFAALVAEGQQMTIDEAVAFALAL